MTTAALTQNPVRALTTRLGEETEQATTLIARLDAALKALDHTRDLLSQHHIHTTLDLGPIGNAAAHARTAALADAQTERFTLPKAS